jgi:drug/metabolite transporter (DMT)-like permease
MTSATHMGLIGSLTPMMVLGLSTAMLGQSLSRGAVLGTVLAIAGVALVVSSGQPATLLTQALENYKRQRRAFRSSRLRLGHCTNLSLG